MGELVVRAAGYSAQGLRPNNEDRYVAGQDVFLVADGMGGQDFGERASGMAAEILPQKLHLLLADHVEPIRAVTQALDEVNQAILIAGQNQNSGRRMGTTAVLAVRQAGQVFVAGLGDSRAYLVRGQKVEQLTIDHTVADALHRNGAMTAEQARSSPYRNVLYKFLGCDDLRGGPEVRPFTPQKGDYLILGSDGLTNFIDADDLIAAATRHTDPQESAHQLVQLALERGSSDNVTCVVVAFS
jgi:serine/threonine protein phosphatase PrpC